MNSATLMETARPLSSTARPPWVQLSRTKAAAAVTEKRTNSLARDRGGREVERGRRINKKCFAAEASSTAYTVRTSKRSRGGTIVSHSHFAVFCI